MGDYSRIYTTTLIIVLYSVTSVEGQCLDGTLSRTAYASVNDITSNNYPSYYSNYIDCTTTITGSGTKQILFHVEILNIEYFYDFLRIYSGSLSTSNLLFHSEYYSAPYVNLASLGEDLTVWFTTDYSVTYGGYKLNYIELDRENQVNCGSAIDITASGQQLSYVQRSTQPTPCTWTLSPENQANNVKIEVLLVQGYVKITEGGRDTFLRSSGSTYVSGQYSSTILLTGQSGNDFVVNCTSTTEGTGLITPSPASPGAPSICTYEVVNATIYQQFMVSPNYPGQYDNSLYCISIIQAGDTSNSVHLTVHDYALATNDFLDIYDGPSQAYNPFSDVGADYMFTSSGSSLTLVFHTNGYGQNRGFNMSYISVARVQPTCTFALEVTVTASSVQQTILSPNFGSGNYYNDDDKYWLIVKPSESDNIVLDFTVFDVEQALNCIYDYVAIYDGACDTDPLLAKFCGHNPVTIEEPTGIYILIHFHTDSSITYSGWELVFYIGDYANLDESTEESTEDDGGLADYIYPIIVIAVILVLAAVITTYLFIRGKGRVASGEPKPVLKRRTTKALITELNIRYNSANKEKPPKMKRKACNYHPQPFPPGPNVNIISRTQFQHPSPAQSDPVYPPDFYSAGAQMPNENITPVLVPGSNPAPFQPPMPGSNTAGTVPSFFQYQTPGEARDAGVYG